MCRSMSPLAMGGAPTANASVELWSMCKKDKILPVTEEPPLPVLLAALLLAASASASSAVSFPPPSVPSFAGGTTSLVG